MKHKWLFNFNFSLKKNLIGKFLRGPLQNPPKFTMAKIEIKKSNIESNICILKFEIQKSNNFHHLKIHDFHSIKKLFFKKCEMITVIHITQILN